MKTPNDSQLIATAHAKARKASLLGEQLLVVDIVNYQVANKDVTNEVEIKYPDFQLHLEREAFCGIGVEDRRFVIA